MRCTPAFLALLGLSFGHAALAADPPALPIVTDVEQQPLVSQVERLVDALEFLGTPLSKADRDALKVAMAQTNAAQAIAGIQKVLDPYCLLGVHIKSQDELSVQA